MQLLRENSTLLAPDEVVVQLALDFMKHHSKLPDLAIVEIAFHPDFAELLHPSTPERRRWAEFARVFKQAGWTSRRRRALCYLEDGKYESKPMMRWSPPSGEVTGE